MRINQINTLNYITAVPLIVMSYHIYKFYETEPVIIRIALAVSFDLMVVVCFYLLKDEYLSRIAKARKATWAVLLVLITFQLYVNIWAYWDLHPFRAILSGSIFPVVVGLISYISSLRQHQQEKIESKKKPVPRTQPSASAATKTASSNVSDSPNQWKGLRVEKDVVASAFKRFESIEQFRGASNWRSVKRWWERLAQGETP